MVERARLVHPEAGPAAVELQRNQTVVTRQFGRVGQLDGFSRKDFSSESHARLAFGRDVRRLARKGYVPGAHNPELVAAIDGNRDDASYLVYADWLAGLGDPRAELIRAQIALEADTSDGAAQLVADRVLSTFAAQLTEAFWRAESSYTWHRGFIDSIDFRSNFGGGYGWPSNWMDDDVLRQGTQPWYLLRSVLRHPSGGLLRWVTEKRGRPREPKRKFQRYRVEWALGVGGAMNIRLIESEPEGVDQRRPRPPFPSNVFDADQTL